MLIELGHLRCDFQPWHAAHGRVFPGPFALDTETTAIVGHSVPEYILGAASDGARGVFLMPDRLHDFITAHKGAEIALHNAPFDLSVLQALFMRQGKPMDVYSLVDQHKIMDTMLLHKLYTLSTDGHTCQGRGQSTLDRCAELYLEVFLAKEIKDKDGDDIRTSWAKWKNRPAGDISPIYLEYLAKDVLCTFGCCQYLLQRLMEVLQNAHNAFGFVDSSWLEQQWARFGIQTHDLQLMGAIALHEIERAGFGLDLGGRNELLARAEGLLNDLQESLRRGGYLAGEPGCEKALQAIIRRTVQENPGVEIPKTATGLFSTKEEDLEPLAHVSEFFTVYRDFKAIRMLINNHLAKMDGTRIHAHYDVLKNTGRTSASSPNVQNLPRKMKGKNGQEGFDIRRCFVPGEDKLFYVADYVTIELCTLSQAIMTQFGLESKMAEVINAGVDVHKFLAARMKASALPNAADILADRAKFAEVLASVTAEERNGAKPASFGLPGGMGVPRLKAFARATYGQPYTDEDAQGWLDAWLASFPEMAEFLEDNIDIGLALAEQLQLTPASYCAATGEPNRSRFDLQDTPTDWLGWMAFKVLKDQAPQKTNGREYSSAILDYYWSKLQQLGPLLEPTMREALCLRQPSMKLSYAVKRLVNRAGVFTITGRLRANASYSARRNTIFQGAASDGAKLALYRLWRSGFKVVAFIHDEVVVEVDANADLPAVKKQIDDILIGAMHVICPDMLIEVKGSFRRRWGKDEGDEVSPGDISREVNTGGVQTPSEPSTNSCPPGLLKVLAPSEAW